MYEHPSDTYSVISVELERVDRANELRRFIADHPDQVITRRRSVWAFVRGRFGSRRTDAAAPAPAPEGPRASGDAAARPAHAQ